MSSPASPPDKETLKHLLPLRYDGKTVIECNHFILQLLIYWAINMTLSTIELKIQVALSLLDGDARTWATPIFAQLAAVQIQIQGATTPFTNEAAFLTAFKAHFGNLDDAAAAQVELTKLCADKSMREKRTAAEFSALFKGPADRSGYGDLELHDKYLSGIPSQVEDVAEHVMVHPAHKALRPASMWPSKKETSLASASAVGKGGTDTSSAPIVRTNLTQNVPTRGLWLPQVPPRL
ncbi:hypothetical protein IEO21_10620 [Rhodonia placenta]|uniref:Retrotransposon gag domain-containing protein n=1 Tax=Rhodonia placenta TaxID=104341 RepID=A0A8H7NS48_9APHY|nr:hypothetical protein IEO21_10620 [Postia placenta]